MKKRERERVRERGGGDRLWIRTVDFEENEDKKAENRTVLWRNEELHENRKSILSMRPEVFETSSKREY